ncbi:MAG: HAMP domain-containing histidine kinase [Acidobacteriota bacterium]|jgi:signal transduction histidine kinase|nr:HAMP domain-containing histidine kinase [Acidobacteriota bacterium]MDQ3421302.1 HAMP domain-containing histidine kinase [Acidobacteriota bacterium]
MDRLKALATALQRSSAAGYIAAVCLPIGITLMVAAARLPAFVFEHLIVLIVVAIAVPWGVRAATLAAIVAVVSDDVLFRAPLGSPTVSGLRDVIDLALFAGVAVVVGSLVATARSERARAEAAAERECRAREQRDRLIATISHDLATPLSVLSGTLQMAKHSHVSSGGDMPRLLARLERATSRATSLVRMLADVQALERGGLALNLAPRDLRDMVAPVVEMLDRFSDRHPVVLAGPEAPVMLMADADRLQRVVENLVNNAIKYSPDGGVVTISISTENGNAVLAVQDQGIGISKEALPRIFEPSYRAPEAVDTAPGLGLGLNIAAQIVKHHGGTMEARAVHPRGTVVLLRLPLLPEQPDRQPEAGQ